MAASAFDTYVPGAVDIAGTILRAADQFSEDPGVELSRFRSSGRLAFSYTTVNRNAPVFTCQTPEIGLALDTAGLGFKGLAIDATPVKVYWVKKTETDVDASASLITTITKGVAAPVTLAFSDGAWILTVQINAVSLDGTTDDIVYSTGASPALGVPVETYTGGSIRVNGEATADEVDCWQNATLNFGNDIRSTHHKGLHYPTRATVQSVDPRLSITNLNPTDRSRFGAWGTRLTDFKLYLRRDNTTDGESPNREEDADTVHIRFDGIDGVIHPGPTTGAVPDDAQQALEVSFDENATTEALVITTGVAIPALT